MTCDTAHDRLLHLPDLKRVPADLRSHLDACRGCAALLGGLVAVEDVVARLPAPSSDAAKTAFLDRLAEPAPIITVVPTVPRGNGWLDRFTPAHLAGLAAGVALAFAAWWSFPDQPAVVQTPPPKPRLTLLQKEVRHVVKLANLTTPGERLKVWEQVAADVQDEMREVYQIDVAPGPQVQTLGTMFKRAVEEGVVGQAEKLKTVAPVERKRLLDDAAAALEKARDEANELARTAPEHSKKVLEKMARTAAEGQAKLKKLGEV